MTDPEGQQLRALRTIGLLEGEELAELWDNEIVRDVDVGKALAKFGVRASRLGDRIVLRRDRDLGVADG